MPYLFTTSIAIALILINLYILYSGNFTSSISNQLALVAGAIILLSPKNKLVTRYLPSVLPVPVEGMKKSDYHLKMFLWRFSFAALLSLAWTYYTFSDLYFVNNRILTDLSERVIPFLILLLGSFALFDISTYIYMKFKRSDETFKGTDVL